MPFIFSISLSLDNELDYSTEFFGSPILAQRCCGCVSNAARKHSNNRKVSFQIFLLSLLLQSFQGQSNKTQTCDCKFSCLHFKQSTATQVFNGAQTYSVPVPQPLKSRMLNSSNVRPKDKT